MYDFMVESGWEEGQKGEEEERMEEGEMGGKEGGGGRWREEGLGGRKEKGVGGEKGPACPLLPSSIFFRFSERNGTVKSIGLIVTELYNVVSRNCKSSFLTAN